MLRNMIIAILRGLVNFLLSLRYRIEVRGKEILTSDALKDKGVLVLPNHPSEIEPFIMMTMLGKHFDLVPLVISNFYNYPFSGWLMKLIRAKPVSEFDKAVSSYKLKTAETLFKEVVQDLKSKKAILFYPSSGLKTSGEEKIGGRSLAHATIQEAPEAEILLVRITGFWGSMFSKAYTESTPDFWETLGKGALILLKNFIFFAPKRKIIIELELAPKTFPKFGAKAEFNKALEDFYNQYPTTSGEREIRESLYKVPLYFWSNRFYEVDRPMPKGNVYHEISVPLHIKQDIMYQLSEMSEKSVKDIHPHSNLIYDLGLDSLNVASLYTHLEAHYPIEKSLEPGDLNSVQDLFAAAMGVRKGGKEEVRELGDSSWPKAKKKRKTPYHRKGNTILEVFLNTADEMKGEAAITDAVSGIMDYKTMKRAIVILAKKIEKLEGKYVGIMLPSSNGVYLVILATMLAGKVPVPLNWTVGSFFLNHAIDLMEINHVITSEKFMKRLDNVDIGKALERLVTLEEIRKGLTLKDKISGAILAKRKAKTILKRFEGGKFKEDDVAFVLFTSGTTALPKAVPLTHKNIILDQRDVMEAIDLHAEDVLIMPLPPFHVFGLNIGLLGLLIGLRTVYSPDPLDGSHIAKEILKWRVSVLIMAPTFFSHLFRSATLSQLKSVRLCASGAEKAPPTLLEFVQKLGSVMWLEGYGLTETSPMISVNTCHARPRGVGKIIPSVDLIVRDPESGVKLGVHQVGEICVAGPTIFSGYYKQDNSDYFVEMDGKKYYKTGDLGYFDEDRYLYLEGRMKLTFKRGGEMINLVAVEKALFDKAKEKGWIDQTTSQSPFACAPKEVPGAATRAVLFSEINIALDQVNNALFEAGFSRLYKINEVIIIDELPLLKSGKVCYRKLFDMLKTHQSVKV
jgi:long-chain-fatty-acid--[acyl-carrier-protein] ligase